MKKRFYQILLISLLTYNVAAYAQTSSSSDTPTPAMQQVKPPAANNVLTKCDELASDTILKTRLQTMYSLNPELERFNIRVDANNGVVTLNGAVQNSAQHDLAVTLAHDVEGVQDVKDNIIIDKNTKAGEVSNAFFQKVTDATLTGMVKSRLIINPKTSGFDITVTTINGIVTLTGEVDSVAEKRLTGNVAIKTPGVAAVKNNIQVVKKS